MPAPHVTPLLLRSDFSGKLSSTSAGLLSSTLLLDKIIEETDRLQSWCSRRFDERIETRYFDAIGIRNGGPIDGSALILDDDLRSVTTLTNGDSTVIASTEYQLLPRATDRHGVSAKSTIHLLTSSTVVWQAGLNDWRECISVAGLWGYGGQWRATGTTLAEDLDNSETGVDVVSGTVLEGGMMFKIDSEYMYAESISTNTATVTRACNGSTAATHANGATIYRWEAAPIVKRNLTRLVLISISQDSSPLFGQLIIGDAVAAVASDGSPKDVLYDVQKAGLKRPQRIMAV